MANKKKTDSAAPAALTLQSLTGGSFGPTFPVRMSETMRKLIAEEAAIDGRTDSAWARFILAQVIIERRAARNVG